MIISNFQEDALYKGLHIAEYHHARNSICGKMQLNAFTKKPI